MVNDVARNQNEVNYVDNEIQFPKICVAQKLLLAASVPCAIIAVIPPLRLAGSLALRSVALIASAVNSVDALKKEGVLSGLLAAGKITVVILGIAGVAAAAPLLIVASLAADIAFQNLELFRAIIQKDGLRALCAAGTIVVDILALASIATGSWQLMVAAASVSAAGMAALGIYIGIEAIAYRDWDKLIDVICYTAFASIGIISAITISEIVQRKVTQGYFYDRNRSPYSKIYYDNKGDTIVVAIPNETVNFKLDAKDIPLNRGTYAVQTAIMERGVPKSVMYLKPMSYDFITEVVQTPISVKELPTVPIGGPSIVSEKLH